MSGPPSWPPGGGGYIDPHVLIMAFATGARPLTSHEILQVLEHVTRVGFDPQARERVRGRSVGMVWRGRVLQPGDRLPPAESHFVFHVLQNEEWPVGTTLDQYVESVWRGILHPDSALFTGRFDGTWQLSIVAPSEGLRGPHGSALIFIEYRLDTGHWVTAFQPVEVLPRIVGSHRRSDVRWLRHQP